MRGNVPKSDHNLLGLGGYCWVTSKFSITTGTGGATGWLNTILEASETASLPLSSEEHAEDLREIVDSQRASSVRLKQAINKHGLDVYYLSFGLYDAHNI